MHRIVTAAEYDADTVVALMREGPWPTWGFRDYAEIFRAVWSTNQARGKDAPPLLVLGLDSDWNQYELWFGKLSQKQTMQILLARERTMTDALENGPLRTAGTKVLAHVGFAHSVTCQGERLGTVLRKRHGDRVFQVAVHQAFPAERGTAALTKDLDALFTRQAKDHGGPFGFDVVGSPLADLRAPDCIFWRMVPGAGLEDFAMGYVFLAPLAELRGMRWLPGFVDEAHFAQAVAVAERLGYVEPGQCKDAAALDAHLQQRFPADPK
jgi:hypothetical protein